MDMTFVQCGAPRSLRLYESFPLVLQAKESRFSIFWPNIEPSSSSGHHQSLLLEQAVSNRTVKRMVPILYRSMKWQPAFDDGVVQKCFQYQSMNFQPYHTCARPWSRYGSRTAHDHCGKLQWNTWYNAESLIWRWALVHYCAGVLTHLQSFIVNPGGLFFWAFRGIQFTRNAGTQTFTDGSTLIRYKKLKLCRMKAEMGAFPLVYSYDDYHEPFDLDRYLHYKRSSTSTSGSSKFNGNFDEVYKMTYKEHCKRRLYTENILGEFDELFWTWLLAMATNI